MMRNRSELVLVSLVLALTGATAAVLVGEARSGAGPQDKRAEFQQLVGGLGFGPRTDLSACPFGFDPRLGSSCQADLGPIPGGRHFCTCHAGSVFTYPALDDQSARPRAEGGRDGTAP